MPKVEAKEPPKTQEPPKELRVDERLMKAGKYEVTKEHTFDVNLHLIPKDNRWVLTDRAGKGVESHVLVFRMWTYDEMVEMRKMSTAYDASKRLHMLDNDALNRLKVQRLIVSWTFDRENPRLKIYHVNGVLTDESWQAFARLQPSIISHIFDEMNRVYEYNG
jgi:hypothetical protein